MTAYVQLLVVITKELSGRIAVTSQVLEFPGPRVADIAYSRLSVKSGYDVTKLY